VKLRHISSLLAAFALAVTVVGCGGSSSNPPTPQAISVSISPAPPSSIDAGSSINVTAVVSNDSANAGVKWSVSCSLSACGSVSAASTASGTATKYSAPASVASQTSVIITATSVSDSTKSATATISISPANAPISVALSAPPTSITVGATALLTANVSNDSANAGVTWSVTCGSSLCGSFNPTSTASGTATTYTAPAAVPSPATVMVTATSVTDTTKSASETVSITAPQPLLTDGNYVFHLAGQDNSGYYYVAGTFSVASGVITAGEQDMVDDNNYFTNSLTASGSSLSNVNGNIQIALNTGNTSLGQNGIETIHGTVVSATRVLISEFDTFASATGSIDQQTSTDAPSGGYAFNVGGFDGNNPQYTFGIGGVINISGSSIVTSGSVLDYNDGGTPAQDFGFASGTVSAPDSFGRVVFTLNPSSASGLPSFALAGYIIGSNQIQLVETADSLQGDLGGTALGQGNNAGKFSAASVAAGTYILGANGEDAISNVSTVFQMAGAFAFNSDGTVSGVVPFNDLTIHPGAQITSGNYTVDATGRVTVNVNTDVNGSNLPFVFQFYLDGNGNALELGVDPIEVTWGQAYLQNSPPSDVEGNFALAAYGFNNSNMIPAMGAVGPVAVSSDNFSGYTDMSVQNADNSASIVTPGVTLTGTVDTSTGQFALYGLNATLNSQTLSSFGYYPIDAQRILAIELDGQQMSLVMMEQIQQLQQ